MTKGKGKKRDCRASLATTARKRGEMRHKGTEAQRQKEKRDCRLAEGRHTGLPLHVAMTEECKELHEYLLSKFDHKWRFDTWKDKYAARIRKYGIQTCKRAIDGFCYPPHNWYMRTVSHRAPELIFRSDKALETFLAKAPEIEEEGGHAGPPLREQEEKIEAFRRKLEFENSHLTARLHRRLRRSELKERFSYHSFHNWIEPLLFVGMENGTVVLFHEAPSWVQEHYAEAISEALGRPVKVVNSEIATSLRSSQ